MSTRTAFEHAARAHNIRVLLVQASFHCNLSTAFPRPCSNCFSPCSKLRRAVLIFANKFAKMTRTKTKDTPEGFLSLLSSFPNAYIRMHESKKRARLFQSRAHFCICRAQTRFFVLKAVLKIRTQKKPRKFGAFCSLKFGKIR